MLSPAPAPSPSLLLARSPPHPLAPPSHPPHPQAFCKHGHCGSLVKVCKGEGGKVSRIGKKLAGFDALEAGAFVVRSDMFDVLHRLLVDSIYCTLAEAMQVFAQEGRLSYMAVQGLDWFGEQTVASLATNSSAFASQAVMPEWRQRALDMLRITSPHLVALSGYSNAAGQELPPVPLYELGPAIGAGCSSVVIEAERHRQKRRDGSYSPASARRHGNLAVKVIRKGASEALGDVERSVMWEVHVLQQLNHNNIVRVMDVIEVVDATYIIMQRVDGPELTEFMDRQPDHRLLPQSACLFFGHMLSALRHAHRHGFLHCDVKPDNVRLNKACDHAVLTDWGYARRPGERADGFYCGTPAYASPEQLTGYSPDSVTGRRKLCPATDVWSLGVTLFEIVVGALPFGAEDHHTLVRKVLATKYSLPDHVPSSIAALIEGMLALAPSDRLDIDEIIQSPHLKATGAVIPDDQPLPYSLLEGSEMFMCGSCEDPSAVPVAGSPASGVAVALDARLRKAGLSLAIVKRKPPPPLAPMPLVPRCLVLTRSSCACAGGLWTLVYGVLCFGAIWSHLQSTSGEKVVHFTLHEG